MLRYIPHNEIDRIKWDKCIDESSNGLIYAYSWYLDIVSNNWDAFIEGDYETVMPITCRKKFFINYIIQPALTQQLGIFSKNQVSEGLILKFLNNIPKTYKYVNINLNTSCNYKLAQFKVKTNVNYELSLNKPYKIISGNYGEYNRKKIKKALKQNLSINIITIDELIKLEKKNNDLFASDKILNILKNIGTTAILGQKGKIYGVFNSENKLIASSFFLFNKKRIIYLFSVSGKEGKKKRAMFLLLNYIIKNYSETDMILDFEGSNIPSIAFFFKGFGAQSVCYPNIKINRLPLFIRYFKP